MIDKDRVVLITGGANGIGKSIAMSYANEGYKVVIFDIDNVKGRDLEAHIHGKDQHCKFYKVDLSDANQLIASMDEVYRLYQNVDILINNAAISDFIDLDEITIDAWDKIINVNLRSPFITSKEFYQRYNGGYGRIINIASTRATMSEPGTEPYSASKGGIVALTHSLAISMSKTDITVNAISPGWIHNGDYDELNIDDHNQHPSKRVGRPDDIARACLFLTDDKNDFINGENIVIDGGMTKKMIYE